MSLEDGISPKVVEGLRNLGHDVKVVKGFDRTLFGRGHIIQRVGVDDTVSDDTVDRKGFYLIGCETRSDGIPCGF